jgi:hypothetical protein
MTANKKWLPPLLCPIPQGHTSHYNNSSNGKLATILRTFSSGKARLYRSLFPAKDAFPGLFVDDDRLKQPSTYYRLFKRRTADKKTKYKKPKPQYIMFDPNSKFIRVDYSLKDSERHLVQDETSYRNRHKKLIKKEIPVGSYVLKFIEDFEHFNWERPDIQDNAPVAVKRCNECPNKTSTQGQCVCGFWSAIRDSTHTKVWWPIHDRRMFDIRQSKEERKKLKIKVSLKSLFED